MQSIGVTSEKTGVVSGTPGARYFILVLASKLLGQPWGGVEAGLHRPPAFSYSPFWGPLPLGLQPVFNCAFALECSLGLASMGSCNYLRLQGDIAKTCGG